MPSSSVGIWYKLLDYHFPSMHIYSYCDFICSMLFHYVLVSLLISFPVHLIRALSCVFSAWPTQRVLLIYDHGVDFCQSVPHVLQAVYIFVLNEKCTEYSELLGSHLLPFIVLLDMAGALGKNNAARFWISEPQLSRIFLVLKECMYIGTVQEPWKDQSTSLLCLWKNWTITDRGWRDRKLVSW